MDSSQGYEGINPVDVSDFAKAKVIDDENDFSWWVPYTLSKQDASISSINSIVIKTTHKYRIEIPTSVDRVYKIDNNNKDTFW